LPAIEAAGEVADGTAAIADTAGAGTGGGGNSMRSDSPSLGIATLGSLEIVPWGGPAAVLAKATPGAAVAAGTALCITGSGSPG
jgi:hypothetical protein